MSEKVVAPYRKLSSMIPLILLLIPGERSSQLLFMELNITKLRPTKILIF